ncbi:MAG: TSUP family transporter [Deltaproteobacteria bacterium]|nr:TSUP family transporter [Deltaproteobacteria bacterium]MDZ4225105.1 TSUP family transporter [bacterium]
MLDPSLLYLAPVVFIAGFIDAIAGGGGLLTLPSYLIAGVPPVFALGTNKFVSTAGTIVSTGKYIFHKRMLWPVVWVGLPCSLIGSVLGAHTVALLKPEIIRTVILVALPVAAALTLMPKPKGHKEEILHWRSPRLWVAVPLISLALGWYDGFFGPGTGTLLMLALYGIGQLSFLHSAATARFFNLVSNAGALVTFLFYKKVVFSLALPLSLASIAGHYIGSHLAIKKGAGLVRGMLMASCTILFAYLLWEQLR